MFIKRLDPFQAELSWLQDEMQRVFGPRPRRQPSGLNPPISMWEEDDAFHVEIELPGLKETDVSIELKDENRLTVTGERVLPEERKNKWLFNHGNYGKFQHEFKLTPVIDGDAIVADFANGVLRIALAKREKAAAQKIKING